MALADITPNITVETKRLMLRPLTYAQLLKYMRLDNSLESELLLNHGQRSISPELREALEQTIVPSVADQTKNYLYSTLWTIISRQDQRMVGDLCVLGEPNAAGEIEIGYGTYEVFQNRGFMTEAVAGIIGWTRQQPAIRAILATTGKQNIASFSVLQKNHFVQEQETDDEFYWRLSIEQLS